MDTGQPTGVEPSAVEPVCYRHKNRVTYLSCSECGKSICPDCSYDSAVGQKCAECSKQTGRGRVVNSRQVQNQRTPVVTGIIVLAAVAFIAQQQSGVGCEYSSFANTFECNYGQFNPAILAGEWWRSITAAFLHVGFLHIGLNMYVLYIFGPPLERQVGGVAFAGLYLASAIGGSVAYLYFGGNNLAMGASGAIWGLFGALIIATWPRRHTPAGASQFQRLMVLVALNLSLPLFIPNVAWQAHLGGLVAGMVIVAGWQRITSNPRSTLQRSLVAYAVAAIGMVLILIA